AAGPGRVSPGSGKRTEKAFDATPEPPYSPLSIPAPVRGSDRPGEGLTCSGLQLRHRATGRPAGWLRADHGMSKRTDGIRSGSCSRRKVYPIPAMPSISEGFGPPELRPEGQSPAAAWRSIKVRAVVRARLRYDESSRICPAKKTISLNPRR